MQPVAHAARQLEGLCARSGQSRVWLKFLALVAVAGRRIGLVGFSHWRSGNKKPAEAGRDVMPSNAGDRWG